MRHSWSFIKRTITKAFCVRLPEFTWTLLAAIPVFLFSNAFFQEVFGDQGINIFFINVQYSIVASLIVSALVSDFIPGFTVYVLNELYWEGTKNGLVRWNEDDVRRAMVEIA